MNRFWKSGLREVADRKFENWELGRLKVGLNENEVIVNREISVADINLDDLKDILVFNADFQ